VAIEIYNSAQAAGSRDVLTNGVKFSNPMVSNGKVFVPAQFAVHVFGLSSPSLNWKTFHFGTAASNAAVSGDFVDPDGDGIQNLMEYAVGSDPGVPGSGALLSASISGGHSLVSFSRNAVATDLALELETSTNLMTWSTSLLWTNSLGWTGSGGASASEAPPAALPPDQMVQVTADLGAPSLAARFVRLRVHR